MKVAILHYACQPVVGGVESIMSTHAGLLTRAGLQPYIVAGRGDPHSLGYDGRIIPELDSRHPQILEVQRSLLLGKEGAQAAFEGWVERISGLLTKTLEGVDACIVHNAFTLHKNLPLTAALAELAQRGRGERRWVAWCHDLAWHNPLYEEELLPRWPWKLLKTCVPNVAYVAVSEQRRQEMADLFGVPRTRINMVPNGIDADSFIPCSPTMLALRQQFRWDERDWVLLAPVRITRRKNLELAIDITAAIRDHGHDALLVITGPPGPHNARSSEYLDELLEKRQALGLEAHVVFLALESSLGDVRSKEGAPLHNVSDALMNDLYWWSDGLLMTSVHEGFGLPLLEGGLARLPLFCSNIPVLREVGGQNANYFRLDDNPAKIAEMVLTVLEKPGVAAMRRRVLATYSWSAIFQSMLRVIGVDS